MYNSPPSGPLLSLGCLLIAVSGSNAFPSNAVPVRRAPIAPRTNVVVPAAQFSVAISGTTPRSSAKKAMMQALRSSVAAAAGSQFTTPVAGSDFDEEYLTNVTVGGQHFSLIVDTGRFVFHACHSRSKVKLIGYITFSFQF